MAAIRACTHTFRGISISSLVRRYPQSALSALYSSTATDCNTKPDQTNPPPPPSTGEETQPESNEVEQKLKAEIEKLTTGLNETQDKYRRALAETENVRQRMKKQIDDARVFGIQGFCKDLLEVADVLGKANESVPQDEISDSNPHLKNLYEGLTMTETQLKTVFKRHGLEPIEAEEGQKFDPNIHEAIFQQPIPGKEPGTIAVVSKVGYKLHSRTIRPAAVGVVKDS